MGDNWQKVYSFTPNVRLGVDTIAIEGHDSGGPAAFIGKFNNVNTKPSDWLCKEYNTASPAQNWNMNDFDDSNWKHPVSYGKNSDKNTIWFNVHHGALSSLSGDAQWLWTNNYNNHDHVYCRMNLASQKDRLKASVTVPPSVNVAQPTKSEQSQPEKVSEPAKTTASESTKTTTVKSPVSEPAKTTASESTKTTTVKSPVSEPPKTTPSESTKTATVKSSVSETVKSTASSKSSSKSTYNTGSTQTSNSVPSKSSVHGLNVSSSYRFDNRNNTHHKKLRTPRHNELIKSLKVFKTINNRTHACVASKLYVKYDGKGSVFVAGVDNLNQVHQHRADCVNRTEGFQKVAQFNPNDATYFSIDVESLFDGHLDCGGSAFWNTQKKNRFIQKCSWRSFGAKNPVISTNIVLYSTPRNVEKVQELVRNDLMGQWYLLGSTSTETKKRQCLVITIFRHDSNFFMKHSENLGKQTYRIVDHSIDSFAIDNQLFKMDNRIYSYKVSEFKHQDGQTEHILLLKNTKDAKDERLFGANIYSPKSVEKLLKNKYKGYSPIVQTCYKD